MGQSIDMILLMFHIIYDGFSSLQMIAFRHLQFIKWILVLSIRASKSVGPL